MRPAGSGVLCSFEDSVAGRWTTFFGYFDSDRLDGTGRANGLRNYAPWNTMITLHREHWLRSKLGGCYMLECVCVWTCVKMQATSQFGQLVKWGVEVEASGRGGHSATAGPFEWRSITLANGIEGLILSSRWQEWHITVLLAIQR